MHPCCLTEIFCCATPLLVISYRNSFNKINHIMKKFLLFLGMLAGVANISKAEVWECNLNSYNYDYILSDFSPSGAPAKLSEGSLSWDISYDWNDPSNQYVEMAYDGIQFGNYGEDGVSEIVLTSNKIQGTVHRVTVGLEDCGGQVYVTCSVGGTTYYIPGTSMLYGTPGDVYFGGDTANGEIQITITANNNAVVKLKYLTIDYDTAEDVGTLDYPKVTFSDGQHVDNMQTYYTVSQGTYMTIDGGNAKTLQVYRNGSLVYEGDSNCGGNYYSCDLDGINNTPVSYTVITSNGFDSYELSFQVDVITVSDYVGFQVYCNEIEGSGMISNYYNDYSMEPLVLPLGTEIKFYTSSMTTVNVWTLSGKSETFYDGMGSITLDTPGYDEITLEAPLTSAMPDYNSPAENIFLIRVNVLPEEPGDIYSDHDPINGETLTLNVYDSISFHSINADRMVIYRIEDGVDYILQENWGDYVFYTFEMAQPMAHYVVEAWRGEGMKSIEFDLEVIDPYAEPEEPEFNYDNDNTSRLAFKAAAGELHVIWRLYDAAGDEIANNVAVSNYRKVNIEDEDELWLNPVDVDDDGYFYIDKPTETGHKLTVKAKTVLNGKHSSELYYSIDSNGTVTGIGTIAADNGAEQTEYYDLRGICINGTPAAPGIYLRRSGAAIEKILIK